MKKIKVRLFVSFVVFVLIVLGGLLAIRFVAIDYMDNYAFYYCRQHARDFMMKGMAGDAIGAEIIYNSDIKDSEKIAVITLDISDMSNIESDKIIYIKFKNSDAAKKYLSKFKRDEKWERYVIGQYYFEIPRYKDGSEWVTPGNGGDMFGGIKELLYSIFVAFDVDYYLE